MTKQNQNINSALNVQKGIEQPLSLNKDSILKFKQNKKSLLSVDDYSKGILQGNLTVLSRAITLIESSLPSHFDIAQAVIEKCLPFSGKSIRIGITGVPGVGKSTFIEALGKILTNKGHKVAVLAIDPSSQISRGSILGDKTRMEELSNDPNAFIRPSPNAGSLGGVARKTKESIILCEAAGFDVIFIETVGVGQSETAVNAMVDFFLLLMLAGAGDELQGIKRGIMEMADAIIINKADGDNIQKAKNAKMDYSNALHLFPPKTSGWIPKTEICSALSKKGIEDCWDIIQEHHQQLKSNNYFEQKRKEQAKQRMLEMVSDKLKDDFFRDSEVSKLLPKLEKKLLQNKISSYVAAQQLLDIYFKVSSI
ncbi:MAG: methylmalonyl Co-A mutase-associated GTPase MeaB [Bacteroidetes bacterium]|nr:methylmalonyl Co-A mutase-associated GTPase MeaB [Bacteroidota bacterium]